MGSAGLGTHRGQLLDEMASCDRHPRPIRRGRGMVRHLLTDPVLPDEMLPDSWPGAALRESYAQFAAELVARRNQSELMEAQ